MLGRMERVGPYEIPDPNARLGEGGMGIVHRAFDPRLRREVALKLVRAAKEGPDARVRLLREARSAAAIAHPNVATIYEVGEHEGAPFIAMELVEGESLRDRLKGDGLDIEEAVRIARGVARGLSAAHKVGVIHRDLKPSNVMLTPEGRVVLLDFGLAQATPQAQLGPTQSVTLTREGYTHGTPGYMPPEQSLGYGVDERSDLFALGVTLYEMLAGRRPFDGTTPTAIALATLTGKAESITLLRPETPPELATLVHALLEKQPEKRPQSAGDVAAALDGLLTETQTVRVLTEHGAGRALPIGQAAGLALLLMLLVGGVGIWLGQRTADAARTAPLRVLVTDLENDEGLEVTRRLEAELRLFDGFELVEPERPRRAAEARASMVEEELDRLVIGSVTKTRTDYRVELRLLDVEGDEVHGVKVSAKPTAVEAATVLSDKLAQGIDGARQRRAGVLLTQNLEAYRNFEAGERAWYAGDTHSAKNHFQEAVELDGEFSLARYRLALTYKWGDDPRARATAEEALSLIARAAPDSRGREVEMLRALIAELEGDEERAIVILNRVLADHPRDKDALFARGDLAYHTGRVDESLGFFQRVVFADPRFFSAYQHYIWALLRAGRRAEVPAALEDFLERHRRPAAFIAAARGWKRLGKLESAGAILERCGELHRDHAGCAQHRAGVLLLQGKHDQALKVVASQIGKLPVEQANDSLRSAEARLLTFMGRREDARGVYTRRAAALATPQARAFYGRWLVENGFLDEAVAQFPASDLEPFDAVVLHAHLAYALALGDVDGARALAKRGPRPSAFEVLVDAHDGCAAGTKVIPKLQRELARSEIYKERYALAFARCLARDGRPDEAIVALRALLADNVFGNEAMYARPLALSLLVELHVARGDRGAAREAANELFELRRTGDPDLPDVVRAKAALGE
jgi:tetratricopeptide (TPR) repeat protein